MVLVIGIVWWTVCVNAPPKKYVQGIMSEK
jgi:hypothetical protein